MSTPLNLKKLLLVAFLLVPFLSPGQTAKDRATLYSDIDTRFPTNSNHAITAVDLRTVVKDVVASAANGLTDGTFLLASGSYADPSWLPSLSYSKITGKPTIDSLVPTQTGHAGEVLTTDGSIVSWVAASGAGDMLRSQYDVNTDGVVDIAALANAVAWVDVTGKPTLASVASSGSAADLTGTLAPDRLASGAALQVLRRNSGNTALEFATVSVGGGDMTKAVYDTNADNLIDVAHGGTGTATPGLVAGTNVTITGTWPNQTVNSSGTGGSGSAIKQTYTQTAHGFTAGTAVYRTSGGAWAKARADATSTADAVGVVESAPTADTFVLVFDGEITLSGLTAGATYFVSPVTAGALTTTEPITAGTVSKPMLTAISPTLAVVTAGRPVVTDADTAANLVFAGPGSGTAAQPNFRALVAADIPTLTTAKISGAQTTENVATFSAAGQSNVTAPAGSLNHTAFTVAGAGAGAYTRIVPLMATNSPVEGSSVRVVVSLPASSNPTVQIRDASPSGTILLTITNSSAVADTATATFVYHSGAYVLASSTQTGGGGTVTPDSWATASGTTVALTFTGAKQNIVLTLSGNTTFTASGYAQGRQIDLFIKGDASTRTLTLPGWRKSASAPTSVAAGTGVLVRLKCEDTVAANCWAEFLTFDTSVAIDADAQDWATRVIAAGGTVSPTRLQGVSDFVTTLKANSLWTAIDRMNLFYGDSLAAALVPLKVGTAGAATETNENFVSGDYSTVNGLTGDGTSKALDTGYSQISQNSHSFGIFIQTRPAITATEGYITRGDQAAENGASGWAVLTTGTASVRSATGTAGGVGQSATLTGLLYVTRQSSATVWDYGTSAGTTRSTGFTTQTPAAANWILFRRVSNTAYSKATMRGYFIAPSAGLTTTQCNTLASLWATFNSSRS